MTEYTSPSTKAKETHFLKRKNSITISEKTLSNHQFCSQIFSIFNFFKNFSPNFEKFPRIVKDVDGDGKADLIAFDNEGVKIVYSEGNSFIEKGSLLKLSNFNLANSYEDYNSYPRFIADIDGDGLSDIIGSAYRTIMVSFQEPDGSFNSPISLRDDNYFTLSYGRTYT